MTIVIALALSYLIGSIPTGYILVRISEKKDIRSMGSRSIGATNVLRAKGWRYALAVAVFDAVKGYLPTVLAFRIFHRPSLAAACAFAAVVGHCYPFSIGFRGGKGVATAAGAYLGLAPAAVGIALPVFLLISALTRYVSLASIITASLMPFLIAVMGGPRPAVLGAVAIGALAIFRHRGNLARLVAGTERKLGERQP